MDNKKYIKTEPWTGQSSYEKYIYYEGSDKTFEQCGIRQKWLASQVTTFQDKEEGKMLEMTWLDSSSSDMPGLA